MKKSLIGLVASVVLMGLLVSCSPFFPKSANGYLLYTSRLGAYWYQISCSDGFVADYDIVGTDYITNEDVLIYNPLTKNIELSIFNGNGEEKTVLVNSKAEYNFLIEDINRSFKE